MRLFDAQPNEDVRFHPASRAAIKLGRMPELTNFPLVTMESRQSAHHPRTGVQSSGNPTMQTLQGFVPKKSMPSP
jgi:hypothetical protein